MCRTDSPRREGDEWLPSLSIRHPGSAQPLPRLKPSPRGLLVSIVVVCSCTRASGPQGQGLLSPVPRTGPGTLWVLDTGMKE